MYDKILFQLFGVIIGLIPKMTKTIKELIINSLEKAEEEAEKTTNPIDDVVVKILLGIIR